MYTTSSSLDIWQKFDSNDAFLLEARMPEKRQVRQFEVTYLRATSGEGQAMRLESEHTHWT